MEISPNIFSSNGSIVSCISIVTTALIVSFVLGYIISLYHPPMFKIATSEGGFHFMIWIAELLTN